MDRIFPGGLRSMVNGGGMPVRLGVIVLLTVMIWLFVWTVHGENVTCEARVRTEEGRFRTLMILGVEYKTMVQSKSGINGEADVAGVFAEVSEGMQLGSRVQRITPEGRNQSVEITRLYAEEYSELLRGLSSRGVKVIACEMRALPFGKDRLLTVQAVLSAERRDEQ